MNYYLEHVSRLVASLSHVLGLCQQVAQQGRLIQLTDELALQAVLHMVHQEMHHCLWYTTAQQQKQQTQRQKTEEKRRNEDS